MYWLVLGGLMGGGWALMKFTVPSKEDMLKVSTLYAGPRITHMILIIAHQLSFQKYPEDREGLKEVQKNNKEIMKALEETAKSKDPFWMKKK